MTNVAVKTPGGKPVTRPIEEELRNLKDDMELMRMQNEDLKAKLLDATVINNKYAAALQKLQDQNEQMRRPPLFICSVIEVSDGMAVLRQHGNNQEVVTQIPDELRSSIETGHRVAVNSGLAIVKVMSRHADLRVRLMELVEAPDVDYDMIGGLKEAIQEVIETVELPLTQPELFQAVGVEPPKGVMLHGPPGTGKTLIAKAVANRTKATFIRLNGSELVQKYIGEGARLVRDVFQLAREKAPSIVFIDEIDAIASRRTYDGTSGSSEVNRTMMQLLAELDGFNPRGNVKIVAATNRIDLLDAALLRPGRFDRIIEVSVPDEHGRTEIFKIHTRAMTLADDVDFTKLAAMTEGLTGADIKAIVIEAGMLVIRRRDKTVNMDDFVNAFEKLISHVQENEPQGMFA